VSFSEQQKNNLKNRHIQSDASAMKIYRCFLLLAVVATIVLAKVTIAFVIF